MQFSVEIRDKEKNTICKSKADGGVGLSVSGKPVGWSQGKRKVTQTAPTSPGQAHRFAQLLGAVPWLIPSGAVCCLPVLASAPEDVEMLGCPWAGWAGRPGHIHITCVSSTNTISIQESLNTQAPSATSNRIVTVEQKGRGQIKKKDLKIRTLKSEV